MTTTEEDTGPAEKIDKEDLEEVESQLGPFIVFPDEEEQLTPIQSVELSPEDIPHFSVPQYFQEIFDKYGLTEKGFDLEIILSSEGKKAEFLEQIRKEIDEDKTISRFTKNELWKAIKSSYSPILFAALWAA